MRHLEMRPRRESTYVMTILFSFSFQLSFYCLSYNASNYARNPRIKGYPVCGILVHRQNHLIYCCISCTFLLKLSQILSVSKHAHFQIVLQNPHKHCPTFNHHYKKFHSHLAFNTLFSIARLLTNFNLLGKKYIT